MKITYTSKNYDLTDKFKDILEKKLNKLEKYFDANAQVKVNCINQAKQDKLEITINCKGKDIEIDAIRLINEDINSIISDAKIKTNLKESIAAIIFSNLEINKKRIEIRKLRQKGLSSVFIRMFIKLLEYVSEI